MYDILFTASVYKSARNALRFAQSIKNIDGNHICVLVTPLREDADRLVEGLAGTIDLGCRVLVFHSTVNSLYQGRGWGFVWAVANGITPSYLCSGDDDIEFTEFSHDIVERLDTTEFSVMTFRGNAHGYRKNVDATEHGITTDLIWLNGDTMFTHFADNLQFGVADSLLDYPVSYFTEIEYQQRMSYFTGRWLAVDMRRIIFYTHHFRLNEEMNRIRGEHAIAGMTAGTNLWRVKYGIELDGMHIDCEKLYNQVITMPEKMKTHFIFHGLWNDWGAIYEKLLPSYELVIDTENL